MAQTYDKRPYFLAQDLSPDPAKASVLGMMMGLTFGMNLALKHPEAARRFMQALQDAKGDNSYPAAAISEAAELMNEVISGWGSTDAHE